MHRAHQAVHSFNADVDAIVTLEDMVDFIGAKDKAPEILVKRNTGSGRRIKMLVVSASIDKQDTAKRLNTMLKTEPVDSV